MLVHCVRHEPDSAAQPSSTADRERTYDRAVCAVSRSEACRSPSSYPPFSPMSDAYNPKHAGQSVPTPSVTPSVTPIVTLSVTPSN